MPLYLHTIKPHSGAKKKKRQVGRGGKRGTYSGRGLKGQKARSGGRRGIKRRSMRQLIEQTHKLPGFKSINKKPVVVNLDQLNLSFKKGGNITPSVLRKVGLVDKIKTGVKILGNGDIKTKFVIKDCQVSKSARKKIEEAGGKVE